MSTNIAFMSEYFQRVKSEYHLLRCKRLRLAFKNVIEGKTAEYARYNPNEGNPVAAAVGTANSTGANAHANAATPPASNSTKTYPIGQQLCQF